ncbi:band 7 family-domain-containing protein [Pelagophyceae sp. CCMP2097]|nr:band 7 family-domain-containing protein [Pelagophyceae sp. CCMP2097]|mmetsp:Transcript_27588/g.92669  ORF Transcript_27588/g.92669 Transcript_27588/m.92669 type:complete len:261 (+) Transcript_27588:81-863(+)|eukprot:CAMPEP_0184105580 /NCGR_PEP_ID=MMETSP0974-20121125/14945_1 /TAXON_ID=483370 /ORGANISM="non described non described, Strain CCMP2097" /LENGTH=260 /DNA_ID=CAMNT_0026408591 /DNA_START=74 /DNA_END=856 /DNA_ORIENTATION=+
MSCVQCVPTSEVAIVERFGKYERLAGDGIHFICYPIDTFVGKVNLRVQSLEVRCETKTQDNVFVDIAVSVQFSVIQEKVYEAFYRLANPRQQITAYVYDVIRSTLPQFTLDQAFEAKDDIAQAVKAALGDIMQSYGYLILNTLVTDMNPDARVRNAMNEINASKRQKEAAYEKAEGDKIVQVKAAEAEAESKYLSGVGVARQRKAIVDGLRDSIASFSGSVKGTTPKDVVDLLLITQYFDMLKDVGVRGNCNTVFVPDFE